MVRKIVEHVPDDVLEADLERYRLRAIELGAADARIVASADVLVDERVRAKCMYPRCEYYGACATCPPQVGTVDDTRKLVSAFRCAVFIKLEAPLDQELEAWQDASWKTHEIVSRIEAEAYYNGYYLAVGFAGQSCKDALCGERECAALEPGVSCTHPLRARPNMHAMGMDAFMMATRQGWDVYPVGESTKPGEVPCLSSLGIVLVY